MGFFTKKKKEDRILPLPEFPRLPNESSYPFYDEQLNENKGQKPDFTKVMPSSDFFEKKLSKDFQKDMDFNELPSRRPVLALEKDDKPVFVKIDKYRESVKALSSIKSKLEEADNLLKNLMRIKQDEERELDEWQNTLNEIRQRLLKIDKDLFEA